MKIVAKLELRPEVVLGEYKGVTVEVEAYKTPEDAFQKWQKRNPNCRKYMVENINIDVVEFHHSIVRISGNERM
jgi:FKBP-type peptidyl-prolyl cis-trans isomerase (trigger factor)